MKPELEFTAAELEALKVGDRVGIKTYEFGEHKILKAKIARLTPKQVIAEVTFRNPQTKGRRTQTYRFWKKDGAEATSDIWHSSKLVKRVEDPQQ